MSSQGDIVEAELAVLKALQRLGKIGWALAVVLAFGIAWVVKADFTMRANTRSVNELRVVVFQDLEKRIDYLEKVAYGRLAEDELKELSRRLDRLDGDG